MQTETLPCEAGIGASLKASFDRDGYVALPAFLNPSEVRELCSEIDRYIRDVVPRLPVESVFYEEKGRPETLKQLQVMHQHDPYFERLFFGERFVKLAELLLGDRVVGKNLQWFNKPPRVGQPTPAHQDGFYFKLDPNEALTMWLALDVVDEHNGCICYVPGSHRRGLRDHARTGVLGFSQGITDFGAADQEQELRMFAQPGDLLVHHSLTIHRADGNYSDRSRKALGFIYYAARARCNDELNRAYAEKLKADLIREGKL
jgi:phytanoyl-CoA hydroxylase